MTVQELIDELNKIEDKSKLVCYYAYFSDHEHESVDKVTEKIYGIELI